MSAQEAEPVELLEAQAAEHAPRAIRPPLPYDEAAEVAVLGAMACSSDACATALDLHLAAHHFSPGNGRWFAALKATVGAGHTPDAVTIPATVGAEVWAQCGAEEGWAAVLAGAIGVAGARSWAERVLDCHRRRRVIFAAEEVTQEARNGGDLDAALASLAAAEERPSGTPESWSPIDPGPVVDAVLAGTAKPPAPTVGAVERGLPLLYAARVNGFHGGSGTAKTMIAQAITTDLLNGGEVVWFIDFEDDEISCVTRLLSLGADPDAVRHRFRYRRPTEVLTAVTFGRLDRDLAADCPALVAVDSTGEWMGLNGTEQSDTEVARWFATCPRRLTTSGAAVLLLDHVPMSDKERLDPIGSHRKKAAITGAQYLVTTTTEMGRGQRGTAKLTTAKDRHGFRAKGSHAADFALDATDPPEGQISPLRWSLSAPGPRRAEPEPYDGLTECMADITTMFSTDEELSTTKLRERLHNPDGGAGYRDTLVTQALAHLVEDGTLTCRLGTRKAKLYRLSTDPCRPVPTQSGQGSAQVTDSTPADPFPPPVGGNGAGVRAEVDQGSGPDAS